jgi:hypothetical protein
MRGSEEAHIPSTGCGQAQALLRAGLRLTQAGVFIEEKAVVHGLRAH